MLVSGQNAGIFHYFKLHYALPLKDKRNSITAFLHIVNLLSARLYRLLLENIDTSVMKTSSIHKIMLPVWCFAFLVSKADSFGVAPNSLQNNVQRPVLRSSTRNGLKRSDCCNDDNHDNDIPSEPSRRSLFEKSVTIASSLLVTGGSVHVQQSSAAVGSLPEFMDANAILQGLTVNVADPSQQKSMIEFLTQGLGFEVLRQRIRGPIEETVRSIWHYILYPTV